MSEPRATESGIVLPEPEGIPICQLVTDVPGLVVNIVIPEGRDRLEYVATLAETICARQRDLAQLFTPGGSYEPLDLADPSLGEPHYLTPAGIRRVVGVSHARAQRQDPTAAKKHREILENAQLARSLPLRRGR